MRASSCRGRCRATASRTLTAVIALGGASACSAVAAPPTPAVDCSPEGVELREPALFPFEDTTDSSWFWFADQTPGAYPPTEVVTASTGDGDTATDSTTETAGTSDELAPGTVTVEQLGVMGRCGALPAALVNGTAVFPEAIPDGERCGSIAALPIYSCGHNDWGAGFTDWSLAGTPTNASEWDGLALWARAGRQSDHVVTLELTDRFGSSSGTVTDPATGQVLPTCRAPLEFGRNCENSTDEDEDGLVDCADPDCCGSTACGCDATLCGSSPGCNGEPLETTLTVCPRDAQGEIHCVEVPKVATAAEAASTQSMEGVISVGGDLADRFDCGNSFHYFLAVTDRWQLYRIPFSEFHQYRQPNSAPAGLDTSGIQGLVVRTEAEAHVELWLDDITFYRRTAE